MGEYTLDVSSSDMWVFNARCGRLLRPTLKQSKLTINQKQLYLQLNVNLSNYLKILLLWTV